MSSLPTYDLDAENDKLQAWLIDTIEDQHTFAEQAQAHGYQLDYSLASLAELERYVIDQQIDFVDQSDEAVDQRWRCWAYLGEVMRRNHGGYWEFSANSDNTLHWGRYVISGFHPVAGVEFEPMGQLRRFTRSRKPDSLRRAVDAFFKPPVDLSQLPTESRR